MDDREKGRYNVQLEGGNTIALKPGNLDLAADQSVPPPSARSSSSSNGLSALFGEGGAVPWPKIAMIGMAVAWLFQAMNSGGATTSQSLWSGAEDDAEYDDRDEGF